VKPVAGAIFGCGHRSVCCIYSESAAKIPVLVVMLGASGGRLPTRHLGVMIDQECGGFMGDDHPAN
jgi:hypothetical protein